MDYKPKNESERRILEYFNANASEDLKARVEASGKTPAGAVKFMESEVRKRFSRASGMVTITDEEGFGIAMHYFEDGNADDFEPEAPKDEKKDPPSARKAKKTKKAPPADGEAAKVDPLAPKAESPKPEVPKAEAPKTEEKKPEEPKMSASESRDRAAGQTFLF